MNVAELERLGINVWSDFGAYNEGGYYVSVEDATNLARRVIAAEKLVEAMREAETVSVHCGYDQGCGGGNFVYKDAILVEDIQPAITAYEATK